MKTKNELLKQMKCQKCHEEMFQLKWTPKGWIYCCRECGYQALSENKKIETKQNELHKRD